MSKQKNMGLVPERRFPEFRDSGQWVVKPFEKVFKRLTTKNSENNQNALTISAQQGLVSQLEYFNKQVAAKDLSGYYLLHKGDFAYNKSFSQGYPMGAIKPLKLYDKGVVSTLYICFRTKNGFVDSFFEHYFETGLLNPEIRKIAQEGGRAHGLLNVSVTEFFKDVNLLVPSPIEQQKIADCLTSVDELLTAQTQKLDALKTHKKGLMQQLFPAEGETVPKRRFPEFQDKGEWEEKFIRDLGEIITGSTPSTTKPEYYRGDRLFVSPADISDQRFIEKTKTTLTELGFSETRPVKPGSILFVCIGSTIGKIAQNRHECATNQQINAVVPSANYVNAFVYYSLENNSEKISGLAGNHAVPIINKTAFGAVGIRYPKLPEQQKIADCLSSVDELITAQTQKLDALKAHKKGLMQQLFPAMEEVKS